MIEELPNDPRVFPAKTMLQRFGHPRGLSERKGLNLVRDAVFVKRQEEQRAGLDFGADDEAVELPDGEASVFVRGRPMLHLAFGAAVCHSMAAGTDEKTTPVTNSRATEYFYGHLPSSA